jgi:hypothetical protein
MVQILQGQITAFFAFDVGYGISLETVALLLASTRVQPLSQKKRTPPYLQYARPPHRVSLEPSRGVFETDGSVQLTLYDFGAASLAYSWPLGRNSHCTPLDEAPLLVQQVYSRNLEGDARDRIRSLTAKIQPAIDRPVMSDLMEDYYLLTIERLSEPLKAEDLVRDYRQVLAQLLRLESLPLSSQQQAEALDTRISYYPDDLVIVDWNAAIVYDRDYEDTANVLEFLNVELLETRYIDSILDQRIEEYGALVHKTTEWPIPLRTPYKRTLQELAEMRTESLLLAERVENSLKLVGDPYLARVHSAAAERFHLREWGRIISDKLDIIDTFYQILSDRVRTEQSQALELTVILVIIIELIVALLYRH